MLGRRLELLLLAEPDPKSGASANFATRASLVINYFHVRLPRIFPLCKFWFKSQAMKRAGTENRCHEQQFNPVENSRNRRVAGLPIRAAISRGRSGPLVADGWRTACKFRFGKPAGIRAQAGFAPWPSPSLSQPSILAGMP